MRKIILASHHKMAEGIKDTLAYIMPNNGEIIAINAYLDNTPVESEIESVLATVTDQDEVLVFTDLLGGSVNQAFSKYLTQSNIQLITGMNLPVIMTILLSAGSEKVTPQLIEQAITEGREQLIYVNQYVKEQVQLDEEDE